MTAPIEPAKQALAALSLALTDVEWRPNSPTQKAILKAYNELQSALAQPLPDPADEYRKGFIDGQIDMRDRPEEQAELKEKNA